MPIRKIPLRSNYIYHILSRGVNRMPIFIDKRDYQRFMSLLDYCRFADYPVKFSLFKSLPLKKRHQIKRSLKEKFVSFISYCLMPNHFHFVLRQEKDDGIVSFINRLLTSYTKFFNTKHERSGPLFESRFRAILVETEEQLFHLVRYVHLNPYSSVVVKTLNELLVYSWSSLEEYLKPKTELEICNQKEIILSQFTSKESFKSFTLDQAEYQKRLEEIKYLLGE